MKSQNPETEHQREAQLSQPSIRKILGLPGGPVVKSPPADAGDRGSIPGPGRSHMQGN